MYAAADETKAWREQTRASDIAPALFSTTLQANTQVYSARPVETKLSERSET